MEITKVSPAGIEFLIKEEGLRLRPYLDSASIPTISIGCTYYPSGKKVTMQDPTLTKEQAISMFKTVLTHYEQAVYSVTRDDITQSQFNALVSLAYNIGVASFKGSSLLKLVNANPSDPAISAAFERWQFANKKPVLLARRQREHALYFSSK